MASFDWRILYWCGLFVCCICYLYAGCCLLCIGIDINSVVR